jgi:quinol-cytochrome oxidoreductase complex cytochrome b subunit
MRPSFFHHLHPPTIPAAQSKFRYTLGAGGLSVYLVFVLLITGILEMFFYVPTPERAGASIQMITFLVPYGAVVRNMHFWAGQFLIITSCIHLIRVVCTGAYAPPRQINYLLGLALFVISLFLDFSGYILRWDEGIHWALVAGTNLVKSIPWLGPGLYGFLVGGGKLSASTLTRFYAWHIFGLVLAMIIFLIWHLFRVRRDGGIAVPPVELRQDHIRITRFELVRREVLAMILASVVLLLISTFVPAPLSAPMKQNSAIGADPRAPWFFLWVQQMLKIGNPFFFGVVVPLGFLIILGLIPYIFPKPVPAETGKWFPKSNRLAQFVVGLIGIFIIVLTILSIIPAP